MIIDQQSKVREVWGLVRDYTGLYFLGLFAFDLAVAFVYLGLDWTWVGLPHIPLSLFGSALGVLVGFRLSGAYNRWWEARQLWGAVVNDSRSLARQVLAIFPESMSEVKTRLVHLQITYVHALRLQLRGQKVIAELGPWASSTDLAKWADQKNFALAVQQTLSSELATARAQAGVGEIPWMQIDDTLVRLMGSQGGLERIKNTPMPRQYVHLLTMFVGIYCLLLPFGLIQDMGIMTPIGSSMLGIVFIALNKIGGEIEAPFENRPADVALTSITTTIEIGLRQLLGETKLPATVVAEDGVVW